MKNNNQEFPQEISRKIEDLTAMYTKKEKVSIEELQAKILKFNKSLSTKDDNKKRTIAEEESIIFQKFKGKKLDVKYFYEHLSDFVFDCGEIAYLKSLSPCKLIFQVTEEVIPEEYFDSFYLITLEQDQNYTKPYDNQVIVYITSEDGVNVYIASLLRNHNIRSKEFNKQISSKLCYYREGVAVYPNEVEKGTGV